LWELTSQITHYKIYFSSNTDKFKPKSSFLIVDDSVANFGRTAWGGCINHILELTTGIAFEDTPHSEDVTKKCHALAGKFTGSSQARAMLIGMQAGATRPYRSLRQA